MIRFALAGNPNSGKTTLFNALTGSTAHVGNWPGVTVDKREGAYRKCAEPISVVDLPGIYSLSPYTPEEVISRNFILDEKPECVINIVDATNLERNLYLTTQVMEIDVPVVIALNMIDEVEKVGDSINAKQLESRMGIPVVTISALNGTGLDELMERAYKASKTPRKGRTVMEGSALMHLIGDCRIALEGQGVGNALFHAIKLVELDELEVTAHPASAKVVEEFKKTFRDDVFGNDFEAVIADSRYKYITKNYSSALKRRDGEKPEQKSTSSDKIDKVLTHRVWGIPIFLVIMFLVFHLTFSEDLFYLGAMGAFNGDPKVYDASGDEMIVNANGFDEEAVYYDKDGNAVTLKFDEYGKLASVETLPYVYLSSGEKLLVSDAIMLDGERFYSEKGAKREVKLIDDGDGGYSYEYVSAVDGFISTLSPSAIFGFERGINSPGVMLSNALNALTGYLGAWAEDGLGALGSSEWFQGFIIDGILGGIFAVFGFLPQILLLFLFFSILEDSGYMARIAFILDKAFRRFGLSGRAFLPMVMGFGCSVPAMINTRTLADQDERAATIRVIPFFSCGAKLPVVTAISGGIIQLLGVGNADVITYSMYILGVVTAVVSLLLMRNTVMKSKTAPFIMELPAYRVPGVRSLALLLWDKMKHFIKKAFTVILASTVALWFVSHFSWNWEFLSDLRMNESILASVGAFVQPLFTPLGFGSQLGAGGWVFVVAAVTGIIAKENIIATFGALSACITAGAVTGVAASGSLSAVMQVITATGITVPALLAFIAFNMTTVPCVATLATAKAELPSKKSFNMTLLFWIATSYVVSAMIYLIGTLWWTSFIFAAVWAGVIAVIAIRKANKKA